MSVASVAQLLANQGGGGGGNTFNDINIDNGTDAVNLSCPTDGNLALDGAFVATRQWADATFETLANMANYSTTAVANGLYVAQATLANYSTTAQANALYVAQATLANYSTTAQANGLYPSNSRFSAFLPNIQIPTGFASGTLYATTVVLPNFAGNANGTLYSMNINYTPNFDSTVFYGVCAFDAIAGTGTRLTVSIRNNGPTTNADIELPVSFFGYIPA